MSISADYATDMKKIIWWNYFHWNTVCSLFLFWIVFCPCVRLDAFHAAIQPTGEVAAAEVVHGHSWAWQEEDGEGANADSACPQTKDVQLSRMEGP